MLKPHNQTGPSRATIIWGVYHYACGAVVDHLEGVKSSITFQGKNILVDLKLFFLLSLRTFASHKLPEVQYTSCVHGEFL